MSGRIVYRSRVISRRNISIHRFAAGGLPGIVSDGNMGAIHRSHAPHAASDGKETAAESEIAALLVPIQEREFFA